MTDKPYAARLEIDYPETRDRVSALLRIFYILPILLILILITGGPQYGHASTDAECRSTSRVLPERGVEPQLATQPAQWRNEDPGERDDEHVGGGSVAIGLFLATALMLLFRRRYPRWWFKLHAATQRFRRPGWRLRVAAHGSVPFDGGGAVSPPGDSTTRTHRSSVAGCHSSSGSWPFLTTWCSPFSALAWSW